MPEFKYRATVISVYDGDTVTLDVDCGFHTHRHERFRLNRINTPELTGPERPAGIAARDYLRVMLPEGAQVEIQTFKDKQEKYGRYLAEIVTPQGNISDLLVHAGFAKYHSY